MNTDTDKTNIGALQASLNRNSTKIRADRAKKIADTARVRYRRKLEDLELRLTELRDKQETIIDMSPDNSFSIVNANNFDPEEFVNENTKLAKEIYEITKHIEVYTDDYVRLFGETPNVNI